MTFANPGVLFLFAIIPILVFWYVRRLQRKIPALNFPSVEPLKTVHKSRRKKLRHAVFVLRMVVISLMILALARPREKNTSSEVITEGLDIMLALDISSSMGVEDFRPKNRLEAAKLVAADFVKGRSSDRIGLVVFAGQSFTQCPLTLDYDILTDLIRQIRLELVEDGTAIGVALTNCINRLKDSKSKSRVVILLTDGQNNRGSIDPKTAAQIAKQLGIKVYTIGVGRDGVAKYPTYDPFLGKTYVNVEVKVDEETLKAIASITDGQFFRATNKEALEEVYKKIDELEKTRIEVKNYVQYQDRFIFFLLPAIGLFLLEIVMVNTVFRRLP